MALSAVEQLRWVSHWPLSDVRAVLGRFRSWRCVDLRSPDLLSLTRDEFVALLVDCGRRPALVPLAVAEAMAASLAVDDHAEPDFAEARIDLLEALAGLALLGAAEWQDKVRFVAELVDLEGAGRLREDQVLALLDICGRAVSRVGGVLAEPEPAAVEAWTNDLFAQLPCTSASVEDLIEWVARSPALGAVFRVVECVYAYEALVEHIKGKLHEVVPLLPADESSQSRSAGLEGTTSGTPAGTRCGAGIEAGPAALVDARGELRVVFRLCAAADVTMHVIDAEPRAAPNLVGYAPETRALADRPDLRAHRFYSVPVRCEQGLLNSVPLTAAVGLGFGGTGADTGSGGGGSRGCGSGALRITLSGLDESDPGKPPPVLQFRTCAWRRSVLALDLAHAAALACGDDGLRVSLAQRDTSLPQLSSGVCALARELASRDSVATVQLEGGVLLVLGDAGAKQQRHLLPQRLAELLDGAAARAATSLVLALCGWEDSEPPLLGVRADVTETEREARARARLHEELLSCLSSWQLRARAKADSAASAAAAPTSASLPAVVVVTPAPSGASYSYIEGAGACILQAVLDSRPSAIAAESVLAPGSQSAAGKFTVRSVEPDPVPLRAVSTEALVKRFMMRGSKVALTFGPVLGAAGAVVIETDQDAAVCLVVTDAESGEAVDCVARELRAGRPGSLRLAGLRPGRSYQGRITGLDKACSLTFSCASAPLGAGAGAASAGLDWLLLLACTRDAEPLADTSAWPAVTRLLSTLPPRTHVVLGLLGGLVPAAELERLAATRYDGELGAEADESVRTAAREACRGPAQALLQSSCAVLAPAPASPLLGAVLDEYQRSLDGAAAAGSREPQHRALPPLLHASVRVVQCGSLARSDERGCRAFADALDALRAQRGVRLAIVAVGGAPREALRVARLLQLLADFWQARPDVRVVIARPALSHGGWTCSVRDTASKAVFTEIGVPCPQLDALAACCADGRAVLSRPSEDHGRFVREDVRTTPRAAGVAAITGDGHVAVLPLPTVLGEAPAAAELDLSGLPGGCSLRPGDVAGAGSEEGEDESEAERARPPRNKALKVRLAGVHAEIQNEAFLSQNCWDALRDARVAVAQERERLRELWPCRNALRERRDALVERLKKDRLAVWERRAAGLRKVRASIKAFSDVAERSLRAVELLPKYTEELARVKLGLKPKEVPAAAKTFSLQCACTALLLAIAETCPEAKAVLAEKANVINAKGEIRLKKDGSYAFSEDLTVGAFKRIAALFSKRVADLAQEDLATAATFEKAIATLHDGQGPQVVALGRQLDALALELRDREQRLRDLRAVLRRTREQLREIHARTGALFAQIRLARLKIKGLL
jgi:hypothetical protein